MRLVSDVNFYLLAGPPSLAFNPMSHPPILVLTGHCSVGQEIWTVTICQGIQEKEVQVELNKGLAIAMNVFEPSCLAATSTYS